ncbi:TetR/AcrR family transcriptional regulator [Inconstantimicrobium mannanitabidum]|uniref:TetR family transcriptional regulator n=1 Tax=Inconstantimicrobium mannanitabidum TaxID=1604901 RepID=A0ACB5RH46_9CLOT|nr:TetR/AcrR family transcriptional regulator [Clostridium sp. TW13]GKX68403.1 TetR family transcriptional regulator [Clostridium sp. TW13]
MNKTKRIIFDSAVKEFSECGYSGATMDDIALKAGVAKGTLYYHFKSKEEIFKFVVIEGIKTLQGELASINETGLGSLDKIRKICKNQLTLIYENTEFFKVLISQLWGEESRQLEIRIELSKYFLEIEKVIKIAMNEGIIKQGNSSLMAFTFFGSMVSTAVYEMLNKDKVSVNEVVDQVLEISLKGILK